MFYMLERFEKNVMNFKKWLFSLKYACFRPAAFGLLSRLRQSQYWSIDRLENWKQENQKKIVLQAFHDSPFYRRLYQNIGFHPGDEEQNGWFERLPLLKKEDVREFFDEICVEAFRKHLAVSATGGSTGTPVKFGYDKRVPMEAYGWRMLEWWGLSSSDDGGYVWRNPRQHFKDQRINEALWWPTRKIRLDASSMSEESLTGFIKQWNYTKPPQLQGYVGAVTELARFIETHRVEFSPPRVVWVTSAPLSSVQRTLMERVFKSPVYDQYGCCEVPHLAAQCEYGGGLHVNAERVYMEFVDADGNAVADGMWGRTLLTKYDDCVFPLIRYEVGDTGRYLNEKCPCGRTLPLIDSVKGRVTDMLYLPSGRILSGDYLTTIFDTCPDAVSGFCVVQCKDQSLRVEYVSAGKPDAHDDVMMVKSLLEEKVAGEVPVRFIEVDHIPHERGKLRFIVRE